MGVGANPYNPIDEAELIVLEDAGGYYTVDNVEAALQEIGSGAVSGSFWDRTGTTLTTHTANDDVQIDEKLVLTQDGVATAVNFGVPSYYVELQAEGWDIPGAVGFDTTTRIVNYQPIGGTTAGNVSFLFNGDLRFVIDENILAFVPDLAGGHTFTFGSSVTGAGDGTDIIFAGGTSVGGGGDGGDLTLVGGTPNGGGTRGEVKIGDGTAGVDYSLNFIGETNSGLFTWMEDEDYFRFADDIHMPDDIPIYFGDGTVEDTRIDFSSSFNTLEIIRETTSDSTRQTWFGSIVARPATLGANGSTYTAVSYAAELRKDGVDLTATTNGGLQGAAYFCFNYGDGTVSKGIASKVAIGAVTGHMTTGIGYFMEAQMYDTTTMTDLYFLQCDDTFTAGTGSVTNSYFAKIGDDFMSNSRAIRIENVTTDNYIPSSLADTGITFDSTDLVLETTTSGDINISAIDDVVVGSSADAEYVETTWGSTATFRRDIVDAATDVTCSNYLMYVNPTAHNANTHFSTTSNALMFTNFNLTGTPGLLANQQNVFNYGTQTVTEGIGNQAQIGVFGSGTMTDAVAYDVLPYTTAAATVTNMIGVRFSNDVDAATSANYYALQLESEWIDAAAGIKIDFDGVDATIPTSASGTTVSTTRITSADSPYTVLDTDSRIFADTDGGAITINLQAGTDGRELRIINCGSSGNLLTIAPNGAELLTGVNASRTLSDSSIIIITYETTEGWY